MCVSDEGAHTPEMEKTNVNDRRNTVYQLQLSAVYGYILYTQHTTTLVPVCCIVLQFLIDYLSHTSLHLLATLLKSQPQD